MRMILSILLLSMLLGCSHSPYHPPTNSDLSVKMGGNWLGNLAEMLFDHKTTYKISDKASDMLWIEHLIDLGQKRGSIRTDEERAWVRKLYADVLINPGNIPASLEETKNVLEKYSTENPPPIEPFVDGSDVLLPHFLIEAIEEFDPNKPVYAASEKNGWLVSGASRANIATQVRTEIKQEGYVWRVKDMKGARFHPAQIKNAALKNPFTQSNIAWARIESVYPNWSEKLFVDSSSGSGPCLLVK